MYNTETVVGLLDDWDVSESYILDLYNRLSEGKTLRGLYLPHSDVYYVRNAIHKATGEWLTCKEVQKLMEEEYGWDKH